MDLYPFLEWLHIVNAAVLFGAGLGSAFHFWSAHKTANVQAIAVAANTTVRMDLVVTTPAVIIQPLTGVLMVVFVGFPWDLPWLVLGVALFALAGLCWIPVLVHQRRARDLARAAAAKGGPLPAAYHRSMALWFRFGSAALALLLAVFYLMVMKPPLWG